MASATLTPRQAQGDPNRPTATWPPVVCLALFAATIVGAGIWLWSRYAALAAQMAQEGQEVKFVLRRLEDPVKLLGQEFSPYWVWIPLLLIVSVVAVVYMVWMYFLDGRAIGPLWGTFLAGLRLTVYVVLASVFMLPALQTWEKTTAHSKVMVLVDISNSVQTSDEIPEGVTSADKLPTRLDKAMPHLVALIQSLQKKNPVMLGRFGGKLDEEFKVIQREDSFSPDDLAVWLKFDLIDWLIDDLSEEGKVAFVEKTLGEYVEVKAIEGEAARDPKAKKRRFEFIKPGAASVEWAFNWLKVNDDEAIPSGLSEEDRVKLEAKRKKLPKQLDFRQQVLTGTNVGDSLRTAINREANNMLTGVVIFSDGRSNQGSEEAFEEALTRASKGEIPIFTVGLGEDRQQKEIRITDIQAPEQTPPNEPWPVRLEVDGLGFPDAEIEVAFDLYRPKADKPSLTIKEKGRFKPGEPPHAQIEIQIDPAKLPAELLKKPEPGSTKPEIEEGEWKLKARIAKQKGEAFAGKEHVSDEAVVQVIKKPLRILLVAGGPTRDFQFTRTMLVREVDKKQAELSIFLQTGSKEGIRTLDVPPERMLIQFPHFLNVDEVNVKEKPEDKYYNLGQYDLIVAFDPNWTKLLVPKDNEQFQYLEDLVKDNQPLTPDQRRQFEQFQQMTNDRLKLLEKWVDTQAAGLIFIGGPINTYQLARGPNTKMLEPILNLMPVIPSDARLEGLGVDRTTSEPWRLNFPGATPDTEFLKLDEDGKEVTAGWEEFFTGRPKGQAAGSGIRRGFYSYYPLKGTKAGATIVATFTDPRARINETQEQPYLVTMPYGKGKTVYVGSGEIWRLRQFKEIFHERFWIKLGRYASAGSRTSMSRRGVLVMGRQFTAGNYVRLEAQMFGNTLDPLPATSKPKVQVVPPAGVKLANATYDMSAKPSQGEFTGWFQGRFLVSLPGEYRVEIQVPGTGDTLRGKFLVKEANPELDNTRPDFGRLYQIASEITVLDQQMQNELKTTLRPVRQEGTAKSEERSGLRLFFEPRTTNLIPPCVADKTKQQRNRGPIDDLWDDGPVVWTPKQGKPLLISSVMLFVVGLLSAEWLTRKLLRLA